MNQLSFCGTFGTVSNDLSFKSEIKSSNLNFNYQHFVIVIEFPVMLNVLILNKSAIKLLIFSK